MKQKTIPIALTSLSLGLLFDWLFYGKIPGISVFLYTILILGFTFYLAQQFKHVINKSIYWLAPVALFFALMVFIRANFLLAFINISLVLYLLLVVVRLRNQHTRLGEFEILDYFKLIFGTPTRILREFVQFTLRPLSGPSESASKRSYTPIIRGLLLSLPILFVFLLLLSSADLVFKKYIDSIFDFSIAPETIFRWFLIGFVSSLFTGAYALIFMPSSPPKFAPMLPRKKLALGATESSIILGSVSLLFFAFVIVQLTYLFGGADQIASAGFTYAEYARKGFFELIAVATISLLLILNLKKTTILQTIHQTLVFKWLSGALIAEVMVIMLSAHKRLNLYEEAYGFTMLRLLSHLFILWLAIALILLLVHIVKDKSEKLFALQLFISVLCFFALVNIINPDAFIARQNIDRFSHTGKIDVNYLSGLSEDATPTVAKLLDHPNVDLQKSAEYILHRQKQYTPEHQTSWQSTNLARDRAEKIFYDNAKQIQNADYYSEYPKLD